MNPGFHLSPLRFLARRFPKMMPIVVSRIFRVTGSSEHKPACNDMKNKQENGSGVSVVSPMLKIESPPSEKLGPYVLISKFFTLFGVMTSFYQRGGDPLFVESG